MKNEKLVIAFGNGYRALASFVFEDENYNSDLHALLEKILKEQIIPNNWYGLVIDSNEIELDDEQLDELVAIDLGYYVNADEIYVDMLDDEKINRWYVENNVTVVYMD